MENQPATGGQAAGADRCVETSRPTKHSDPTFIVDGVIHYCVTNMPGAVGRTSTYALTNATFAYAKRLADKGWRAAAADDSGLRHGLNVVKGEVTNRAVAETFGLTVGDAGLG